MFPNLYAEMARNGISQKVLALEMGLTEKTLGAKLRGEADFKFSEMVLLKRKFKKALDYLFQTADEAEAV